MDEKLQKEILANYFSLSKENAEKLFEKISLARICLVGCGATGSFLGELLVRSGFKNFILIDGDGIERKNLSRQNYFLDDIGKAKVKALASQLLKINSKLSIRQHASMLSEKNSLEILENVDFIIECSDSFTTKQLIGAFSKKHSIPWIYTGVEGSELLIASFNKDKLLSFDTLFSHIKQAELGCDNSLFNSSIFSLVSLVQIELIRLLLEKKSSLLKTNILSLKTERITL